jgi:7,8-dihydropterin-6-yl-methyl-4-(beta-D-ribofuranosyl)aminobenzene 5'-phosphate synthase
MRDAAAATAVPGEVRVKITTLVENDPLDGRDDLSAEFGLSLHVEVGEQRILFDAGTSGVFADNAAALGIDIAAVDAAVLSHHHFDHGGGLARFLEINDRAPIYLREAERANRFFKALAVLKRPIGIDLALLDRFDDRVVPVSSETEIAPGVLLITDIGTSHERPEGNRHLFVEQGGGLVPDSSTTSWSWWSWRTTAWWSSRAAPTAAS